MSSKKKEEVAGTLDDIPAEEFLSTGILEVDEILGGGFPKRRITQVWGSPGCFAKGTPVLTEKGYKPIEAIVVGDRVASFDGELVSYNEVLDCGAITNQPKPMIQFSYGKDTITATYDHPFYNGEKYYPVYQLAWGDMEASQRLQLQLLCKQYGQAFNYEVERGVTHKDTQTWERPVWPPQNSDEWENSQGSSSSSPDMDTKPQGATVHKPQRLQASKQQHQKPGMVYAKTEQPSRLLKRTAQQGLRSGERGFNKGLHEIQPKNAEKIQGRMGRAYRFPGQKGQEATSRIKRITGKIPGNTLGYNEKCKTTETKISQIIVKTPEPYYALSIKNVHTYIVGRSHFPVHNTGKSYLLAKCMAAAKGKVLYVDAEFALSRDRLEKMGVSLKNVDYVANSQLEVVAEYIIDNIDKYDLVIIDTLAKLTPITVESNQVGVSAIGLAARQISHFEAKLRPKLYKSKAAVIGVNQVRASFSMGPATTQAFGGWSWGHTVDLSLKLSKGANNKVYKTKDGVKEEVGHWATVKVDKSRISRPFKQTKFLVEY